MNSLIYQGEVSHARLSPVKHSFRYPVYFYAFDIDELPELARQNPLFGYNQLRPVAIHDKDYLQANSLPLQQKLGQTLAEMGINEPLEKVVLVTSARYFNYVFNPVSFFYCYNSAQQLRCVLAQVNNTFGEMHLYLLDTATAENREGQLRFRIAKQFHVSPFFSREGNYEFFLTEPHRQLDNKIHYHRDEQLALIARLHGQAEPLTGRNLLRTLIKHPLTASLTMPRILWQAAKLYRQRRLPVNTKPVPNHDMTIRPVPPTLLDRLGRVVAHKHFSQLQQGALQIKLPDGGFLEYGDQSSAPQRLQVQENRFFSRVMTGGEIGFGEAYTDGDWTTADLTGLLTMLAGNSEQRLYLLPILSQGRRKLHVASGGLKDHIFRFVLYPFPKANHQFAYGHLLPVAGDCFERDHLSPIVHPVHQQVTPSARSAAGGGLSVPED
jgi:cyclopropane-fatty-acyl-phospholipid synthase